MAPPPSKKKLFETFLAFEDYIKKNCQQYWFNDDIEDPVPFDDDIQSIIEL